MERNMRASLILSLLLVYSWSCVEMVNGQQQQQQQQRRQQQQQQSCRGQHLRAQQPYETIRSEAGTIELSTRQDNDELDCAGVEFIRETIERDGLSVPRFQNTPELVYIVEGEGRLGVVFPGCPETFRRPPFGAGQGECQRRRRGSGRGGEGEGEEEEEERGSEEERSRREQECAREESSQRVRRVRRGDVVAIFAGAAYWWFNDGDKPLRIVAIADSSNYQNQLDKSYRVSTTHSVSLFPVRGKGQNLLHYPTTQFIDSPLSLRKPPTSQCLSSHQSLKNSPSVIRFRI